MPVFMTLSRSMAIHSRLTTSLILCFNSLNFLGADAVCITDLEGLQLAALDQALNGPARTVEFLGGFGDAENFFRVHGFGPPSIKIKGCGRLFTRTPMPKTNGAPASQGGSLPARGAIPVPLGNT